MVLALSICRLLFAIVMLAFRIFRLHFCNFALSNLIGCIFTILMIALNNLIGCVLQFQGFAALIFFFFLPFSGLLVPVPCLFLVFCGMLFATFWVSVCYFADPFLSFLVCFFYPFMRLLQSWISSYRVPEVEHKKTDVILLQLPLKEMLRHASWPSYDVIRSIIMRSRYEVMLLSTVQTQSVNSFFLFPIIWTRKAPGALDPAVVPPPGGVKYATVTQDKSPCLCSERHDEYLFGRAKTGGLGQVTTQKKKNKKRPRGIGPRCFSPPPRGQNMLRSLNIRAQGV